MMSETIKIVLVDDELLFEAFHFFIGKRDNIEVVYEASNGIELIDFLNQAAFCQT
jgi:YesN/AraC family two-component response regulator